MTEKTINCEECKVEFTFEENPKFPRKYCLNCSAKKKAAFKQDKEDNIEREPVKVGDDVHADMVEKAEKQRVYDKHKVDTVSGTSTYETKDDYEEDAFQIKSKQVRSNALNCAVELLKDDKEHSSILGLAKEFEKYIRFGK